MFSSHKYVVTVDKSTAYIMLIYMTGETFNRFPAILRGAFPLQWLCKLRY